MLSKSKNASFAIHYFMPRILGLGGSELLVYALIFSFCSAGEKFYGSVGYIADRTGLSPSSVKRALRSLSESEYIFKGDLSELGTVYYDINRRLVKKAGVNLNEPESVSRDTAEPFREKEGQNDTDGQVGQNEPSEGSKRTDPGVKMSYNNKYIIKNTTTSTAVTREKISSKDIRRYGSNKLVMMSRDQMGALYDRFGDDVVDEYLLKLDSYLLNYPTSYFKNHYKTIISWIEDDFRL